MSLDGETDEQNRSHFHKQDNLQMSGKIITR